MKTFDWGKLSVDEFVVLDIETTGLSPAKGARIIEIGAVKIKNGEIVDEFSTFINPELKIPAKITSLTGITNTMVEDAPVIGIVLDEFKDFIKNSVIVAHNSPFDWDRFLVNNFNKIGVIPENEVIDTKVLSKLTFPLNKKHTLADMCSYLDLEIENHHRAIFDAKITAKAFLKFLEIHKDKLPVKVENKVENKVEDDKPNIKVKRIKYWEKGNSKRILFQRIYVNLFYNGLFANIYFDIPSKCWYVKETEIPIDLKAIECEVLKKLKLSSVNELCDFRN